MVIVSIVFYMVLKYGFQLSSIVLPYGFNKEPYGFQLSSIVLQYGFNKEPYGFQLSSNCLQSRYSTRSIL